jgi:hypothetical protein
MTVRNAVTREQPVDAQLGARKDALLQSAPNSRTEQVRAAAVALGFSVSPDDARDLLGALFAPPRPGIVKGSGQRHPADCPCTSATCRKRRARVAARAAAAADPSIVPHGSSSGYVYHGCRCPDCTSAHSATSTKSRRKKGEAVDAS